MATASNATYDPLASGGSGRRIGSKLVIYGLLVLFALYFLIPLVVVVFNSFRSLPDIMQNGVLGLPRSLALDNWKEAWGGICIGGTCEGISPYFWNSFKMVIPATIISTIIGETRIA